MFSFAALFIPIFSSQKHFIFAKQNFSFSSREHFGCRSDGSLLAVKSLMKHYVNVANNNLSRKIEMKTICVSVVSWDSSDVHWANYYFY